MAAPVNSVLPTITGTVDVGETLTCSTGTWTGGVQSYAFQWKRVNANAVDIEGATHSEYVVTALDCDHMLQCVVTATNNTGSTSISSLPTITVPEEWFIVEDGTGIPNAISYISLDDAGLYFGHRGNNTWNSLTHGEKKAALVKATDYLTQMYRLKWAGTRATGDQALDWPRAFVPFPDFEYAGMNGYTVIGGNYYYPANVVPSEVKNATAELAIRAASGELAPDVSRQTKREKVDVIEVEYMDYQVPYTVYRSIDGLLMPLLKATGGAFRSVIRT